jgi:hypothetical protein
VLDTSGALDALLKYIDQLLDRMSVNGRTPKAWLGRVKPSDFESGIHMLLTFGPLVRMVTRMRLSRDDKYRLMLKFVWRLSKVGNAQGVPDQFVPARLQLGSFVPTDLQKVVEVVTSLLAAGAISLETALQALINAGMPIEDAAEEIRRIEERDFAGAGELLDATGDEGAVFDYLGREPAAAPGIPAPPEPVLPPVPEQTP